MSGIRAASKPHTLGRVYYRPPSEQRCSVPGCGALAVCTVALVDYYEGGTLHRYPCWLYEQDQYTPFLCAAHLTGNQCGAQLYGPRQASEYPFTNQGGAAGWSEYLPLSAVATKRKRAVAL